MKTVGIVVATVIGLVAVVGGFAAYLSWNNKHKDERGIGNSAKSGVDSSPAKIYQMPYGYDNVAEKCDDRGNLLIITANANTTSFTQVIPNGCK